MKIIIAPDSFKESMSAYDACVAIENAILSLMPNATTIKVPMADGGEGTVEALTYATNGKIIKTVVKDPLLRDITATYGMLGTDNTAVIEMASASGLERLAKQERNPMLTSTYGTGQLIRHAIENGAQNIIVGIGGSATNDGGAGMLQALGVVFYDSQKQPIKMNGQNLAKLHSIDTTEFNQLIQNIKFSVACDVDNPLTGTNGAAHVYARQKGATTSQIKILDHNLKHFAALIKEQLDKDIINTAGAGAAGGLGGGLLAFMDAKLTPGVDLVIKTTQLKDKIMGADLVITGEGKIDNQTKFGKTPYGVAMLAKTLNTPVIALAGSIDLTTAEQDELGFNAVFNINPKIMPLEKCYKQAKENIAFTTQQIFRMIKLL